MQWRRADGRGARRYTVKGFPSENLCVLCASAVKLLLYSSHVVIQENVPLAPLTTLKVGGPDALALAPNQNFLLVANSKSGDVAFVRTAKLPRGSKISAERSLFTMAPVGLDPRQIAVKTFVSNAAAR